MRFVGQKAVVLMKMGDLLANTAFGEWIGTERSEPRPAPNISRLAYFLIVARPLAKLEEEISELKIEDILRFMTSLYNQVAAMISSPRSTDDGHQTSSAGREACRQGRLGHRSRAPSTSALEIALLIEAWLLP